MPAASNDDNFFGAWPSRSEIAYNGSGRFSKTAPTSPQRQSPINSGIHSPTSLPSSPVSMSSSPPHSPPTFQKLRRSYSSTFTLIPEDRVLKITTTSSSRAQQYSAEEPDAFNTATSTTSWLLRIVFWWPLLLLNTVLSVAGFIRLAISTPNMLLAPTFWLSAVLWILYKVAAIPLAAVKYMITVLHTPFEERKRKKHTVLISGGNTIQTLHMARNFYSSGWRVVVFDFNGLFGLGQFSTAVSKYYSVAAPHVDSPKDYIDSLCRIVEIEKPTMYLPVCDTTSAHFDGLAKPHLELMGCISFIPGTQEISVLDDINEVLEKCERNSIVVPAYRKLTSIEHLKDLYSNGWLQGKKNILVACGKTGVLERRRFVLPSHKQDLQRFRDEISDLRPWVVIRDPIGQHYVTCTTIKDSRVVANVTCSIQPTTRSLVPDASKAVDEWLDNFFAKVRLQRPINAHMSFRFVRCKQTNQLMPVGCRVGVALPYICYTGVHSKLVYKPCPHFTRNNSGPIVQETGRYWIHDAVLNTLKHPSVNAVGSLIGTVLDKREAIFVYWDPLPYCAYYYLQLPLMTLRSYLWQFGQ